MNTQIESAKLICRICLEQTKSLITLTNCGHQFCHRCVNRHLNSLIQDGVRRIQNFRCPDTQCQKQICQTQLEKHLDFEYFHKISNRVLFEYSMLCPDCRTRIDLVNNPENWRCFNCYCKICKFCKSQEHGGRCQIKTIYFNQVRTTITDEQLGYCPQCITPFLKDENCDHVTCVNPQCNFEFCFFCSANFSPIYHHGGIYHRTDCRNYEVWEDFEPYHYADCTECQKEENSNGCPLPTQNKEEFMKDLFKKAENIYNPQKNMVEDKTQ